MIGRWIHKLFAVAALMTCAIAPANAQQGDANPARFLIVYDSSNSMWGELSDQSRKYEAGRLALAELLRSRLDHLQVGLRAYGHRRASDCTDTELVVPIRQATATTTEIGEAVEGMRPTGRTPITRSLREGRNDLGPEGGDILLISDGIETCDIDPCELMAQWASANVNIRVHVVGVGLGTIEREAMSCIAEESGGRYFDADSAEGFAEAVTGAREAIEITPGDPAPAEQETGYALLITGRDNQGRDYLTEGRLFRGDEEIAPLTSNGRNVLPGPGTYEIEVGPTLADGTIYRPVRQSVTIDQRGETSIAIEVFAPARVSARFREEGEDVRGSLVRAYRDDREVFRFRHFDEALASPGEYEFRATPNADNTLSLNAALTAGTATELVFEMTTTVEAGVILRLPNGDAKRGIVTLWRDDEQVYSLNGAGLVRPGVYEVRAADQNVPLVPVDLEIGADGGVYELPLAAGFATIAYAPSDQDYISNPNRAFIESLDRGGSSYASVDAPIALAPGQYRVTSTEAIGFFDPVDFTIANGESQTITMTPWPLGEIVVSYAPSDDYLTTPDRASVYPLDGQQMRTGFMRPNTPRKFLPGRYRVEGWSRAGDIPPQEITVHPHETTSVTLAPR